MILNSSCMRKSWHHCTQYRPARSARRKKIYEIRFSGDLHQNASIILRRRKTDTHARNKPESNNEPVKLTQYSKGAGCGCKIAPNVLQKFCKQKRRIHFRKNLLVGNSSNDDAAVYDLGNGTALVSTTGFLYADRGRCFDFGKIAAANAISDVYAMGGKPLMAIAILGWPVEKLPASLASKCSKEQGQFVQKPAFHWRAGIVLIAPGANIQAFSKRNCIHTKPETKQYRTGRKPVVYYKTLGAGYFINSTERGLIKPEHEPVMIKQMTALNKPGEKLWRMSISYRYDGRNRLWFVRPPGWNGRRSRTFSRNQLWKIPVAEGAKEYLAQRIIPDATYRNWNSYSSKTGFDKGVNVMEAFNLLPDPQTNGGLLFAVKAEATEEIVALLKAEGLDDFIQPVGRFVKRKIKRSR